ncbi:mechanosensitive ion channel domain-containing protein [Novipirellula artificiosorum]|nr:mechanosensitive ion channel domain-containing protein [Novipirellula artificiosorum]
MVLLTLIASIDSGLAADSDTPTPKPQTIDVVDIPVDQLQVMVKPLTREELQVEIDAWQKLVRQTAGQIADIKRTVKVGNEVMAEAAEVDDVTDSDANTDQPDVDVGQLVEEKEQALNTLSDLQTQQTDRIERLSVVLKSFEKKGGDTESYDQYIEALRGVEIDTSDTAATWAAIKGWFRSEEGGIRWAWRLFSFFLVLAVTLLVAGFVSRIVHRWLDRTSHLSKLAEHLISRSIRRVILLLGFLIALTRLGIDIGPLLAAVGATGFIIGFALQGTLSNFASGLMILLNRPFDVGDVVNAGGVAGTVSEMNLVSTTFKSFDNQKIIVPNNEIWDSVITNVTANNTRRVDLTFGCGYDDDLDRVEQVLTEAVHDHPLVLEDPAPTIKLNELAESSVNFIVRPWSKTTDYWTVHWDLTRTIKKRFDEEGISIPFPQQDVHVKTVAGSGKPLG